MVCSCRRSRDESNSAAGGGSPPNGRSSRHRSRCGPYLSFPSPGSARSCRRHAVARRPGCRSLRKRFIAYPDGQITASAKALIIHRPVCDFELLLGYLVPTVFIMLMRYPKYPTTKNGRLISVTWRSVQQSGSTNSSAKAEFCQIFPGVRVGDPKIARTVHMMTFGQFM